MLEAWANIAKATPLRFDELDLGVRLSADPVLAQILLVQRTVVLIT